jgi:hypothetical protein
MISATGKRNDGDGTEMAIGLPNQSSSAVATTLTPSWCSAKSKARCVWRALSVSRTRRRYEILHHQRDDALHRGLGETASLAVCPRLSPSRWSASTP